MVGNLLVTPWLPICQGIWLAIAHLLPSNKRTAYLLPQVYILPDNQTFDDFPFEPIRREFSNWLLVMRNIHEIVGLT